MGKLLFLILYIAYLALYAGFLLWTYFLLTGRECAEYEGYCTYTSKDLSTEAPDNGSSVTTTRSPNGPNTTRSTSTPNNNHSTSRPSTTPSPASTTTPYGKTAIRRRAIVMLPVPNWRSDGLQPNNSNQTNHTTTRAPYIPDICKAWNHTERKLFQRPYPWRIPTKPPKIVKGQFDFDQNYTPELGGLGSDDLQTTGHPGEGGQGGATTTPPGETIPDNPQGESSTESDEQYSTTEKPPGGEGNTTTPQAPSLRNWDVVKKPHH